LRRLARSLLLALTLLVRHSLRRNNTGKIIGIGQALMWLREVDEATDIPAIMLFDSCYAANMVAGR
jgi:hypothetical protein